MSLFGATFSFFKPHFYTLHVLFFVYISIYIQTDTIENIMVTLQRKKTGFNTCRAKRNCCRHLFLSPCTTCFGKLNLLFRLNQCLYDFCLIAASKQTDHRLNTKMEDMTAPHKVKAKHLDRHLVAGCSIGHSPFLHVKGWKKDQSKMSNYISHTFVIKDDCCHFRKLSSH